MSNQNVTIDGNSGNILPSTTQNAQYLSVINKQVVVNDSMWAKAFGQNNRVQKELKKIDNQIKIMTAITEGNSKITTIIRQQQQQLLINIARLSNDFSILISDIERYALQMKSRKLSELSDAFLMICDNIDTTNYPEEIKNKLLQIAENEFEEKISILMDIDL